MFPKEKTFVAYNFSLQLKFESKTNEVMGTSAEQTAVEFYRQKEKYNVYLYKTKISQICSARVSGEWNDISNIVDTSGKKYHPLKTQAKTTMFYSPVTPQVEVPLIWLNRQSHLSNSAMESAPTKMKSSA